MIAVRKVRRQDCRGRCECRVRQRILASVARTSASLPSLERGGYVLAIVSNMSRSQRNVLRVFADRIVR